MTLTEEQFGVSGTTAGKLIRRYQDSRAGEGDLAQRPAHNDRGGNTMLKVDVGDKVVLRTTWMSSRNRSIHTVKKITATGKIRLSNGLLFDPFGRRIERWWGGMWLEVVP